MFLSEAVKLATAFFGLVDVWLISRHWVELRVMTFFVRVSSVGYCEVMMLGKVVHNWAMMWVDTCVLT